MNPGSSARTRVLLIVCVTNLTIVVTAGAWQSRPGAGASAAYASYTRGHRPATSVRRKPEASRSQKGTSSARSIFRKEAVNQLRENHARRMAAISTTVRERLQTPAKASPRETGSQTRSSGSYAPKPRTKRTASSTAAQSMPKPKRVVKKSSASKPKPKPKPKSKAKVNSESRVKSKPNPRPVSKPKPKPNPANETGRKTFKEEPDSSKPPARKPSRPVRLVQISPQPVSAFDTEALMPEAFVQ